MRVKPSGCIRPIDVKRLAKFLRQIQLSEIGRMSCWCRLTAPTRNGEDAERSATTIGSRCPHGDRLQNVESLEKAVRSWIPFEKSNTGSPEILISEPGRGRISAENRSKTAPSINFEAKTPTIGFRQGTSPAVSMWRAMKLLFGIFTRGFLSADKKAGEREEKQPQLRQVAFGSCGLQDFEDRRKLCRFLNHSHDGYPILWLD